MSNKQKYVLIVGLMFIFAMVVIPPWFSTIDKVTTYGFLFNPPDDSSKIDFVRLVTQIILIVISCSIFYLVIGIKSEASAEHSKTKLPVICIVAVLVGIIFLGGFFSHLNEEDKKLKDMEQLNEQAHRQRLSTEVQKRAFRDAVNQKVANDGVVAALAKPKDWGAMDAGERGVNLRPITYWRDGNLILRVQLFGEVQNLEIATGKHKSYRVNFFDTSGLANYTFQFSGEDFRPYKGKGGAISVMMTAPTSRSCSQGNYQSLERCSAQANWH